MNKSPTIAIYHRGYLAISETFVYRQIVGLRRYQPIVFTDKLNKPDRFPLGNVPLVVSPRKKILERFAELFTPRYGYVRGSVINTFVSAATQRNVCLVHAQFGPGGIRMLPVVNRLGVPLITTFRGYDVSRRLRQKHYVRALKKLFDEGTLFLSVCGAFKKRLFALGAPEERIIVHYNGTPLDLFKAKHYTGRKDGRVRFLQVGRYTEKKGVPELVDAFSRVIAAGIDAELVLVGGGRTMADTKKRILLHGLSDRVILKGVLPAIDVAKEMEQADIFLQNSMTASNGDVEGLPNTVIEAMASALPVVASRHMGVPEAVEDGESGILFDERDFNALTDAMIRLSQAPEKWEAMGVRGRQIVEKKFDLKSQNERLERIYDRVLSNQPIE